MRRLLRVGATVVSAALSCVALGVVCPGSADVRAAVVPGVIAPVSGWGWPVPGAGPESVLAEINLGEHDWEPGHRGVDLVASPGDPIVAAGAGIISFAGPLAGRGVVVVVHGELRTTYEPVDATVSVGAQVVAGDQIGMLEGAGGPDGPSGAAGAVHCRSDPGCLHWGLRRGEVYLDPLMLVLPTRARLIPPLPW